MDSILLLLTLSLLFFFTLFPNPSSSSPSPDYSIITAFDHDYSPPSPPPPPPHPPSVSCEDDLGGIGSLDTTCQIVSDLNLTRDVYIQGEGNFVILPFRSVTCLSAGCEITINITGNFSLGDNATVLAGTFELEAYNASFSNGSLVTTTGLGGSPPAGTSHRLNMLHLFQQKLTCFPVFGCNYWNALRLFLQKLTLFPVFGCNPENN